LAKPGTKFDTSRTPAPTRFEQNPQVRALLKEAAGLKDHPPKATTCVDKNPDCKKWLAQGNCALNPSWMAANCCMSCSMRDERPVMLAAKIAIAEALEHPGVGVTSLENAAAEAAKHAGGSAIEATAAVYAAKMQWLIHVAKVQALVAAAAKKKKWKEIQTRKEIQTSQEKKAKAQAASKAEKMRTSKPTTSPPPAPTQHPSGAPTSLISWCGVSTWSGWSNCLSCQMYRMRWVKPIAKANDGKPNMYDQTVILCRDKQKYPLRQIHKCGQCGNSKHIGGAKANVTSAKLISPGSRGGGTKRQSSNADADPTPALTLHLAPFASPAALLAQQAAAAGYTPSPTLAPTSIPPWAVGGKHSHVRIRKKPISIGATHIRSFGGSGEVNHHRGHQPTPKPTEDPNVVSLEAEVASMNQAANQEKQEQTVAAADAAMAKMGAAAQPQSPTAAAQAWASTHMESGVIILVCSLTIGITCCISGLCIFLCCLMKGAGLAKEDEQQGTPTDERKYLIPTGVPMKGGIENPPRNFRNQLHHAARAQRQMMQQQPQTRKQPGYPQQQHRMLQQGHQPRYHQQALATTMGDNGRGGHGQYSDDAAPLRAYIDDWEDEDIRQKTRAPISASGMIMDITEEDFEA
jgi:hypothetical protein